MQSADTPSRRRNYLIVSALGLGGVGALVAGLTASSTPAAAQLTVFDPNNYSQNLLTAARTLQQINNQIQSLQNEAMMLINQAKNLSRIDFPQLQQITQTLQQVDQLMGQAQGIGFRIDGLDEQFRQLFPTQFDFSLTTSEQVANAQTRLETTMAAFRQTMGVQAQIVENVQADGSTLSELAGRSQSAEGSLQVQQATNQLLALAAKQQFQIQNLLAAQYRADAMEAARRIQTESDARGAAKKFLGSGSAYTPQ